LLKGFPFIIEKAAVSNNDNQIETKIYYHREDGPNYEIASLSKSHIFKHLKYNPNLTEDGIEEETVPLLSPRKLFEKHSLNQIDLLFIDAE
jgi:hypothetical protein